MKKILLYIGATLFSMQMMFTSCQPEMFYENPEAETTDTYYNTKEHLTYSVNAAYNVIQVIQSWARNMPYILNTRSDEMLYTFKAAAGDPTVVQLSGYTASAAHSLASEVYSNFYTLQFTSNLALEKLEANQDNAFDLTNASDKALHDRLMGEAYFLRAFSRFYLTFLFGDEIPDRDYTAKANEDFYVGPSEKGVIYQAMVEDLKKAEELLPVRSVIYSEQMNIGRATKGSAQMLLAKAYMARPILDGTAGAGSAEWELAKAALKRLIESNEYELVNNYCDNSSEVNENNKESVFELQFVKSLEATSSMSVDRKNFGQNSWRQVCMTVPDPIAWWNAMPSLLLYNEFERDASGNIIDPRAYQGLWIPNGAKYKYKGTIGATTYSGERITYEEMFQGQDETWLGKWFGIRKNGTNSNDFPDLMRGGANERILRYADALLMYAECCVETGDEATALQYINKVRERANKKLINPDDADAHMFYAQGEGNLPTAEQVIASAPLLGQVKGKNGEVLYSGMQINTIRRLLKHEYSVELFVEGWRFFNLMRWYNNPNDPDQSTVLNTLADKYKVQIEQTGMKGALAFDYNKHSILAIPSTELQNNPSMKGNKAN